MLMDRLKEARVMLESVSRIGPRPNESVRANSARAEPLRSRCRSGSAHRDCASGARQAITTVAVTVDGGPVADLDSPTDVDPRRAHRRDHARSGDRDALRSCEGERGPRRRDREEGRAFARGRDRGQPRPVALLGRGAFTGASLILGSVSGGIAIANHDTAAPSCIDNQCAPSVRWCGRRGKDVEYGIGRSRFMLDRGCSRS